MEPRLSEFEAQITHYMELGITIMEEPEHYDVGPVALYTGLPYFKGGLGGSLD
jgi:hypothetical protein